MKPLSEELLKRPAIDSLLKFPSGGSVLCGSIIAA